MKLNALRESCRDAWEEVSRFAGSEEAPRISDPQTAWSSWRLERKPTGVDSVGHIPTAARRPSRGVVAGDVVEAVALHADHVVECGRYFHVRLVKRIGKTEFRTPREEGVVCEKDGPVGPREIAEPTRNGPKPSNAQLAADPLKVLELQADV